jgi:hypothetical protein
MEHGRFSKEYAQFLADRFYRRYKETCSLKVGCIVHGCEQFMVIRANTPETEQSKLMDTFKCELCCSTDYDHSSRNSDTE